MLFSGKETNRILRSFQRKLVELLDNEITSIFLKHSGHLEYQYFLDCVCVCVCIYIYIYIYRTHPHPEFERVTNHPQ